MSRERIKSRTMDNQNSSLILKEIKSTTRGLFGKSASSLPQRDQDYLFVGNQLANYLNEKQFEEVTLKQVSHFFLVQYRFRFNQDCIDYNWFNFQNTMKKLKDYLSADSWVEVSYFLYSSIEKSIDKVCPDIPNPITLSVFKRAWLIEELLGGKQKFSGFY
uniref:Uncharacterized protein n=1 Tax=Siphoviridae sp. ctaDn21 TaxID=2825563 RepID=A0A8S5UV21_9CAUD|nr:MAG TPA: hypothetical protein [Siphoviridae sp. ctaDn21]